MDQAAALKSRIHSIDILRGIVMVIMALDHTRDFFHDQVSIANPTDLSTTTPALFFTRWITHYCAPTFVFLAGTSAYLLGLKRTKAALSSFLIKRGVWLVLIEIVIVTLGWTFDPLHHVVILQVIWAIGCSMIILGLLVWLPWQVIFAIGLVIVFGHNILDSYEAARNHQVGFWWNLLHHARFNFYPYAPGYGVFLVYAFGPWAGVMALGYCFGQLFRPTVDSVLRKRALICLGLTLILLFVVLRFMNGYGDPAQWGKEKNTLFTVLSFLNVTKYPPSLMFLCMTLGPSILVLAFMENIRSAIFDKFRIIGRVPFFYYILHFYILHTLVVIAFYVAGYGSNDIIPQSSPFLFRPDHFGYPLWGVYLVWLLTIVILYPLCRWYNRYKSTHHQWWLSYL